MRDGSALCQRMERKARDGGEPVLSPVKGAGRAADFHTSASGFPSVLSACDTGVGTGFDRCVWIPGKAVVGWSSVHLLSPNYIFPQRKCLL